MGRSLAIILLLFAGCLLFTGSAAADEFDDLMAGGAGTTPRLPMDFSGNLWTKFAFDLQRDNDHEDLIESRSQAFAAGVFGLTPKVTATISGLAEYVLAYNPSQTDAQYQAILYELYAELKLGMFDLRLGQQAITWGVTDLMNPVDNLTPKDLDRMANGEMGWYKRPEPAVRATFNVNRFYVEGVYEPFFRPDVFSVVGSDWSLLETSIPLAVLLRSLNNVSGFNDVRRILNALDPSWASHLQKLLDKYADTYLASRTKDLPDDFTNPDAAIRAGGSMGPVDMAVSYAYLWTDFPIIKINPQVIKIIRSLSIPAEPALSINDLDPQKLLPLIKANYERTQVAGLEFSVTAGDFVFRTEAADTIGGFTYNKSLEPQRVNSLTYVGALEYTWTGGWTSIFQLMHSHYFTYQRDFLTGRDYVVPMVLLRKSFLEDRMEFEGVLMGDMSALSWRKLQRSDLSGLGYMFIPMLSYAVSDPLKIYIGANLFGGGGTSLFGLFQNNSQVWMSARYGF